MIPVEDIRFHLRIDATDEDDYLLALRDAALEYIEKMTGQIASAPDYPLTLRHAALLLIGAWYANREAVADGAKVQVPLAFEMLINLNRPAEGLI